VTHVAFFFLKKKILLAIGPGSDQVKVQRNFDQTSGPGPGPVKFAQTSVEEGVEVLEVPIKGCPVTTMKVSVKQRINGNTQKSISNEKTCKDMCTNSI